MPLLTNTSARLCLVALLLLLGSTASAGGQTILLRGTVVDAETKTPLPCRISIQGQDGAWHFPSSTALDGSAVIYNKHGLGDPGIVEKHTTLSPHPFQISLPAGRYAIVVERGKEYHSWTKQVEVGTEPISLTIPLRRWSNMASLGWYSGETHVHRPVCELPNILLAEDLNIAFPLVDWVREAYVAPTALRSGVRVDRDAGEIVVDPTHRILPRNTEYELFTVDRKPHTLGAFFVINHKTPLDLGAPPVRPVAERAHREGALIELDKHNWPWSMAIVPIMPVDLFELSNNHVWPSRFGFAEFGEPAADYMHIERDARGFTEQGWIDFGLQNYYALLDCGFSLRPTAGTASGVHPVPVGFSRVYVHLKPGERFDGESWLNGLNAGRSFVTTGPMLLATLNGQDPGPVAGDGPYRLVGSALGAVPLKRVEVVINGEVKRSITPANRQTDRDAFETAFDETLPIEESSWIAVRCFEDRPGGRVRFAHTAPFHVAVPGKPLRPRKEEVAYLIERVKQQIARSTGVLADRAIDEYREALRTYERIAAGAR